MSSVDQQTWLYCSYCERAFQARSKHVCTYDNCTGELGDVWDWAVLRKINPAYPEIPQFGKEYPLFGNGRTVNLRKAGYDEETAKIPYNC